MINGRSAVRLVTRREVRETLADWRIVFPMLVLSLLLPMIMAAGTLYVVDFLDDPEFARRLLPTIILLVGFIPASFSIVTALESFVGERERNTLESLLAMPVSDRTLYISKFAAALLVPLVASYTAMIICCLLLLVARSALFFSAFSPDRFLLLFAAIGLLAGSMVAGAVVISSHVSTIRAANLMSSFVLLPAAALVQAVTLYILDDAWGQLWLLIMIFAALCLLLLRVGLKTFNREMILSREQRPSLLHTLRARWQPTAPAASALPTAPAPVAAHAHAVVMHASPGARVAVRSIIRREIGETLSDWRVLLPLVVLTLGIPLLVLASVDFTIAFIGDRNTAAQLIPFALLVTGFIPASFSLITALEAFVGERERNTLESLLAMPITDRNLYLGKLLSALFLPIGTSLLAMVVLALGFVLLYPDMYVVRMTTPRFALLAGILAVEAVAMVAAAGIISTHTSSMRAANLLASFVLVPITSLNAVLFPFFLGTRSWDVMPWVVVALIVVALGLLRTGIQIFNREEILSRENDQFNLRRIKEVFVCFFNEYHPAGVRPDAYRGLPFAPLRFYRHELPALLRELRVPLLIVVGGSLVAVGFGYWLAGAGFNRLPDTTLLERLGDVPDPGLQVALAIMLNNLRVSVLSNLLAPISFGTFALSVPLFAFLQIGYVPGLLTQVGGTWATLGATSQSQFLLAYVLPHGIIELPTFILSAALGLRLGAAVMSPPAGFSVGDNVLWAAANLAKSWLLVIAPLVIIAALVEGFVTPLIIRALYGG